MDKLFRFYPFCVLIYEFLPDTLNYIFLSFSSFLTFFLHFLLKKILVHLYILNTLDLKIILGTFLKYLFLNIQDTIYFFC